MGERDKGTLVYAVAAAGVLFGVVAVWLKARDGSHPVPDIILTGLAGFFFLGAGVFARQRRPDNRTGLLMVAVGIAMFAEDVQFAQNSFVFTLGVLVAHASSPVVVHLVLAFPRGVLGTRPAKALVAASYFDAFGLAPLKTLFGGQSPVKPTNLLVIGHVPVVADALNRTVNIIGAIIAVGVAVLLYQQWRRGTVNTRRVFSPVLGVGLVGALASAVAGMLGPQHADYQVLITVYKVAFCLWPLAFAVGVLRAGPRPAAVADLLVALRDRDTGDRGTGNADELRDLLAQTLRDPSLRLWLWHPPSGTFRDAHGQPVNVETDAHPGSVTYVDYQGRRIAALVSRSTSWEDPRLLKAIGTVAGLVVDNQLRADEERAQLAEVRASRTRLLELADAERQRVERDLHDGAQQRLVAVALGLRLAQQRLGHDGRVELAALLSASVDEVDAAMAELRDLARGIHPAILTQAGLVPAVAALIERTPVPIELSASSVPRFAATIEATGYFVVAEAVTNALKHSGAERMGVDVLLDNGFLRVRVTDDGIGGAELDDGSGLTGLRDRVHAIGGELTVRSVVGDGTIVEAAIPVGDTHV